jgi:hypothetical protein
MRNHTPLLSGTWTAIVAAIARVVDLESTAREFKALQRVRKIRTAEALLRLALMWGPGRNRFERRRPWPEMPVLPI